MIPTEQQAKDLWEKYAVPDNKRRHLSLVASVSKFLAGQLMHNNTTITVNTNLLVAAALLHDLDKQIPRLTGEQHPDTAVRVLTEEGMEEVADLVKNHPLHRILDPATAPKRWEEKILFLSDKMVKYEIISVDERFALWRQEDIPQNARVMLEQAYPKVKQLEQEIFSLIGTTAGDVAKIVNQAYT
jgi:HD superfamily phosphodiesterase